MSNHCIYGTCTTCGAHYCLRGCNYEHGKNNSFAVLARNSVEGLTPMDEPCNYCKEKSLYLNINIKSKIMITKTDLEGLGFNEISPGKYELDGYKFRLIEGALCFNFHQGLGIVDSQQFAFKELNNLITWLHLCGIKTK